MQKSKRLFLLLLLFLVAGSGYSQHALLESGPMLGHIEMQEANIWIQTKSEADVSITYWPLNRKNQSNTIDFGITGPENSYIKEMKLVNLEYGTEYNYEIMLNGENIEVPYETAFKTQELWQWRKDPPPFTVAFGSCLYINDKKYDRPGKPYGDEPGILTSIADVDPDLMIWMGDNIYYREPDFYSVARLDYRNRDAATPPRCSAFSPVPLILRPGTTTITGQIIPIGHTGSEKKHLNCLNFTGQIRDMALLGPAAFSAGIYTTM